HQEHRGRPQALVRLQGRARGSGRRVDRPRRRRLGRRLPRQGPGAQLTRRFRMAVDLPNVHERALENTRRLVAGVNGEEWDGATQAQCAVSYGPVPGEIYAGHRFIDVLIHGWDLAKGTGQDAKLPADLVEACFEVVEPQKDLLAGSGAFGSHVDVPPGADRQTQLLAMLGRKA